MNGSFLFQHSITPLSIHSNTRAGCNPYQMNIFNNIENVLLGLDATVIFPHISFCLYPTYQDHLLNSFKL